MSRVQTVSLCQVRLPYNLISSFGVRRNSLNYNPRNVGHIENFTFKSML